MTERLRSLAVYRERIVSICALALGAAVCLWGLSMTAAVQLDPLPFAHRSLTEEIKSELILEGIWWCHASAPRYDGTTWRLEDVVADGIRFEGLGGGVWYVCPSAANSRGTVFARDLALAVSHFSRQLPEGFTIEYLSGASTGNFFYSATYRVRLGNPITQ